MAPADLLYREWIQRHTVGWADVIVSCSDGITRVEKRRIIEYEVKDES